MIHIEPGVKKSILIDMNTCDVRSCDTSKLELLEEGEKNDISRDIRLKHYQTAFDINILDIKFNSEEFSAKSFERALLAIVPENTFIWSHRIILNAELSVIAIKAINNILNKYYFHFGGLLVFPDDFNDKYLSLKRELFLISYPNNKESKKYYKPNHLVDEYTVALSWKVNLFYHKRVSLSYDGTQLKVHDNKPYDIPKNLIEVCKECQFKAICVDSRKVQKTNNTYKYKSDCAYDPYKDEWKE